jgi:acid stress-induced BolA-like protein IbaG/YrbA
MATRIELEHALSGMPGIEEVTVVGDHSLIATVVSRSFKDLDEAFRQEAVWKYLREKLGSIALQNVEFTIYQHARRECGVSITSLRCLKAPV